MKPTSNPLSGRRTERDDARDRERSLSPSPQPRRSRSSRRAERDAARDRERSFSPPRGRSSRRASNVAADDRIVGPGSPYEAAGAPEAVFTRRQQQARRDEEDAYLC